jgi:hypothetical protein
MGVHLCTFHGSTILYERCGKSIAISSNDMMSVSIGRAVVSPLGHTFMLRILKEKIYILQMLLI